MDFDEFNIEQFLEVLSTLHFRGFEYQAYLDFDVLNAKQNFESIFGTKLSNFEVITSNKFLPMFKYNAS